MRFATWVQDGQVTTGVASDDGLHAFDRQATILELVRAGLPVAFEAGAAALGRRPVDLAAVRLLPPIAPPTVRDFAAFEEHVDGAARSVTGAAEVEPEWYKRPVFYFSNPYAVIGAHDQCNDKSNRA